MRGSLIRVPPYIYLYIIDEMLRLTWLIWIDPVLPAILNLCLHEIKLAVYCMLHSSLKELQ